MTSCLYYLWLKNNLSINFCSSLPANIKKFVQFFTTLAYNKRTVCQYYLKTYENPRHHNNVRSYQAK